MAQILSNNSSQAQKAYSKEAAQKIQFTRSEQTFIGRDNAILKLESIKHTDGSPVVIKYKSSAEDRDIKLILAIGTGSGVGNGYYKIVSDSEVIIDYFDKFNESKSGIWVVDSIDDLLSIPEGKKIPGMLIFLKDENRYYTLSQENNKFEVFKPESSKLTPGNIEDEETGKLTFLTSSLIYDGVDEATDRLNEIATELSYGEPIVLKYRDGSGGIRLLFGVGTGVPSDPISIIGDYDDIKDLYDKIGDLELLMTSNRSNIVGAINELSGEVNVINGDYKTEGSMRNLIYKYNESLLIDPGVF